jgi:L-lactate dehydrogenase
MRDAIREMKPLREDAIIIVVSNPVDFLTHLAQTVSELPTTQVFGTGTYLSTVRLNGMLASKTGVCISQSLSLIAGADCI